MPLPPDYQQQNICPALLAKSQPVRLIDIFLLGPAMVYVAMNAKKEVPSLVRAFLLVSGAATTIYNGINYLELERIKQELENV